MKNFGVTVKRHIRPRGGAGRLTMDAVNAIVDSVASRMNLIIEKDCDYSPDPVDI
jgi:hypothetical protein